MPVKVMIPSPLRPYAGKRDSAEFSARTVGEALGHGRQVICSDHDALHAASHGQAAFLDPLDHRAWTSAIRAAAASGQTVSDRPLPTWDECAALLRKELLALVNEKPGS